MLGLGTAPASLVVTFPTVAAHIMGQLMKYLGKDRIVFGSDSVWYGSPQWQIEAMWRFEIPEELRQRHGYPELAKGAKRHILGQNSARLYKLPAASEASPHGKYRPVVPVRNFIGQALRSLDTRFERPDP
jgi:uncharacterized protein